MANCEIQCDGFSMTIAPRTPLQWRRPSVSPSPCHTHAATYIVRGRMFSPKTFRRSSSFAHHSFRVRISHYYCCCLLNGKWPLSLWCAECEFSRQVVKNWNCINLCAGCRRCRILVGRMRTFWWGSTYVDVTLRTHTIAMNTPFARQLHTNSKSETYTQMAIRCVRNESEISTPNMLIRAVTHTRARTQRPANYFQFFVEKNGSREKVHVIAAE